MNFKETTISMSGCNHNVKGASSKCPLQTGALELGVEYYNADAGASVRAAGKISLC